MDEDDEENEAADEDEEDVEDDLWQGAISAPPSKQSAKSLCKVFVKVAHFGISVWGMSFGIRVTGPPPRKVYV